MSAALSKGRLAAMVCEALADVHTNMDSKTLLSRSVWLDWELLPPEIHIFSKAVHFGARARWANGGPVGQVTAIAMVGEMTRVEVDLVSRSLSSLRIGEEYVNDVLPEFMLVANKWGVAAKNAVRELAGRVGYITPDPSLSSYVFAGPVST